jgi:asparagine synthase (glutamine-hydrolysing)
MLRPKVEYDETAFQRLRVERLESDRREGVVSPRDIADAFPDVVANTEGPILRTTPARCSSCPGC